VQRVEFRKFAEESITHNLKMSTHADNLIVFAECCEDDGINKDDLLDLLRPLLSSSKLYKTKATLLKNQLKRITISLDYIGEGIVKYNQEITEKRGNLPDKINMTDKIKDDALSDAKMVSWQPELGLLLQLQWFLLQKQSVGLVVLQFFK
jgi:hypothetical protein